VDDERERVPIALSVAAVGVVFGDIGTSPLYSLRACFEGLGPGSANPLNVLGVLSLIFWSLTLVISVKYVSIILRADNKGEGGVLALTSLVLSENPYRAPKLIAILGLIGCALFYGDGVITPAVTVLGAVEGLSITSPGLSKAVLPITLVALLWLFSLQRRGTGAIGRLFGPFMVFWFLLLAALGAVELIERPHVLFALNPYYALVFLNHHAGVAFIVFGAVFLAVTGGEALYADLGHFGRKPIARAWFVLVWPCLVLNYFGQGALLLEDPAALSNPFYLLAPEWSRGPLVIIATAASIIASQAVLAGVFAIAYQCQQLGYLPPLRTRHSSEEAIGQVYVPVVNWLICGATLALTIGFGSSSSIANAYGVGVSCTMVIDTLLIVLLLIGRDTRRTKFEIGVLGILLLLDLAFVLSNLGKVPTGGWFPLLFGLMVFGVMRTWQNGRESVSEKMRREERSVESFLTRIARHPPLKTPGVAVFLTSNPEGIPRTLVRNLKMNGVMHEFTIIFTRQTQRIPRVMRGKQIVVKSLAPGLYRVTANVGFMEVPTVPKLLKDAGGSVCPFTRTTRRTSWLGMTSLCAVRAAWRAGANDSSCSWRAMPNMPPRASGFRPRASWKWAVRWRSDADRSESDCRRYRRTPP
jgi:KUP system potassium uptake protein